MSEYRRFRVDPLRLQSWDYSLPGYYFITLLTKHRVPLFGHVAKAGFMGNDFSRILDTYWRRLPEYYNQIRLDEFQAMPDHVHFIIEITGVDWENHFKLIRLTKMESGCSGNLDSEIRPSEQMNPTQQIDSSQKSRQKLDQKKKARRRMLIPKIVGQYRTQTAKAINIQRKTPGKPVWQPHYYERIVRNPEELVRIRRYIADNPWH